MKEHLRDFQLVVPLDRPINIADEKQFTGTDLACLTKLVTAANRAGLEGYKLESLRLRRSKKREFQFEFVWEAKAFA